MIVLAGAIYPHVAHLATWMDRDARGNRRDAAEYARLAPQDRSWNGPVREFAERVRRRVGDGTAVAIDFDPATAGSGAGMIQTVERRLWFFLLPANPPGESGWRITRTIPAGDSTRIAERSGPLPADAMMPEIFLLAPDRLATGTAAAGVGGGGARP